MKRIIIYCILLVLATMIPINRIDISNLEPIQAIWMYEKDGMLCIKTDTADEGGGDTVQQALEEMKKHSEGIIYLDTAEYLLVSETAENQIVKIKKYLNKNVKVARWEGEGEIKAAAKYMTSHKMGIKLNKWNSDIKLPIVSQITNSTSNERGES